MSSVTFADVVEGVRAAIAAHAHAQDDGRTDDLVAVYCDDAVVEVPGMGTFDGRDAIHAAFAGWAPQVPQRHIVSSTLVTSWSDGEASSTSDVVFVQKSDAGWAVQVVARYHDEFRNESESWRLSRRTMEFSI
jgi:ketosteroid isomerase-like protein